MTTNIGLPLLSYVWQNDQKWNMLRNKLNIYVFIFCGILALCVPSCAFNSKFYKPSKENTEITWAKCEESFFEGVNGKKLHFAFFKPIGNEVLATVFILHGNGGNLAACEPLIMPFVRNGFQVFIFDYQGFGKSEGKLPMIIF